MVKQISSIFILLSTLVTNTGFALSFEDLEGATIIHPEGLEAAQNLINKEYSAEIRKKEITKVQIRFYFYSQDSHVNKKGSKVQDVLKIDAETKDDLVSFDGWDVEDPDTKKVKSKKKKKKKKRNKLFQIFAEENTLSQLQELAESTFKDEILDTCGEGAYLKKVRVRINYKNRKDKDSKKVKFVISPLKEDGTYTVYAKKLKVKD